MQKNISLATIDIYVIGIYILVLLLIGFISSKKRKGSEDLFLSSRNLTWPKIGLSLFSTNVSPMMMIGFAGLAYSQGMVGANFEWLAWLFLMLLAMVFLPHYQKNKISTMPGFLDLRFGKRAHTFLSYYLLLSTAFLWLGCALYAGGLIISQAIGIPLYISVIGIAIIAVSYTAIGGLAAVVRTDMFQSSLIIAGSIILTILAFSKIGSIDNLIHGVPEDFWHLFKPATDPDYSWNSILLGYLTAAIFFFCIDQTIVQKVLAAKNIEQGQKGAFFTSSLKLMMPVIFIFPGIMAAVLYPGLKNTDEVYLKIVTGVLPAGLIGLMVAVMLAALINTIAAGLNSFSTILTLDVYSKIKPGLSDPQLMRAGQFVIVVIAIVAIGIAILLSFAGRNLFEIGQGILQFFAPPLSAVFLVGVLWKRATPKAAEITLLGGAVLCFLVGIAYYTNIPNEGFWPDFLILSFYLFVVLLIVMIISSLLTNKVPEKELYSIMESYRMMGYKSGKMIWLLWGGLAIIMDGLYIIFN